MQVKPAGVADVVHVYGDTAVPRLADTPGFRETLLFADPADGQLISQTGAGPGRPGGQPERRRDDPVRCPGRR